MPISTFTRLCISLPLLALPLLTLGVSHAKASGTAAEEAVRILTRAWSSDSRCKYLSSQEKSELARFTARAEMAAASQASAAAARSASAAGQAEGKSVSCSTDVEADVRETLVAARAAVAAASAGDVAPEKPAMKAVKRMAATVEPDEEDKPAQLKGSSLGQYARVVRAYYLERECRSLSRRDADRFWSGVVKLHKATLKANRKSVVARVMASAERLASGSACGKSTEAKIQQGYELVSSR